MKIVSLTASNVKRLKAIEIAPDGNVQIIGGRNAQGKSSVLDAIWLALGGGAASKETVRPIRDGEEKASVVLDLGDFKVTRSWTQSGTQLKVENAEGAKFSSPQGILDALVGKLAFDPLAFTRLSAKDQVQELLALVDLPIDLDQITSARKQAFDERTEIGRQGKAIGDVTVDHSLPDTETSATEILGKIREAQDHNTNVEQQRIYARNLEAQFEADARNLESLKAQLVVAEAQVKESRKAFEKAQDAAKSSLPIPTDGLESQLSTVEDSNAAIRANNLAKARKGEQDALRAKYADLTATIEGLDKSKTEALAAAEFPIVGLSFDEDGVTYNGVPFSQASSAEQIRVSLAIAMALNPKLKVLRIADGSLLDSDTLALIKDAVTENDYQLWIERVGNADEGAVIIEDGEVAE